MLSILIPVYNYDISRLVGELHRQGTEAAVDFEILILDDASTRPSPANEALGRLPFVSYSRLPENIGRARIRNRLAAAAAYENLLFLDCDAEIGCGFINNYLPFCDGESVVLGGIAYDEEEKNPAYSLRLKYGRKREARPAPEREKHRSFATFNFLIPASVLKRVGFDERLRGYGNEDTLLGYELCALGVPLYQIDNPALHRGLDENPVFLEKTRQSVANLFRLLREEDYASLLQSSQLLRSYFRIRKLGLLPTASFLFRLFRRGLEAQLCSPSPSLFLFDLYKLGYLCRLAGEGMTACQPLSENGGKNNRNPA